MAETVIIGAGIVGITTAYFLSEHQPARTIHLVEKSEFLASASGYAGGFLARDWFGPEVSELAGLSYDQHHALAAQFDGRSRWGYEASTSLNYELPESASGKQGMGTGPDLMGQGTSRPDEAGSYAGGFPAWIHRRNGDSAELRGSSGSSAQIDPLAFSRFFLNLCRERGVYLHQPARVVSVGCDKDGELESVSLESAGEERGSKTKTQKTLPCTRLIIAAGAWSGRVFDELFGDANGPASAGERGIPISSIAGHSLLLRTPPNPPVLTEGKGVGEPTDVYAVFAAGGPLDFRVVLFGRADGSVYLAGLNSTAIPIPVVSTESVPCPDQLDHLLKMGKEVFGRSSDNGDNGVNDVKIVRSGLCHRPVTPWGFPLVLRLPDEHLGTSGHNSGGKSIRTKPGAAGGVFVAAGHGAWGISMGPGTGLLLAELAQGRPLSADLSGLGFHGMR